MLRELIVGHRGKWARERTGVSFHYCMVRTITIHFELEYGPCLPGLQLKLGGFPSMEGLKGAMMDGSEIYIIFRIKVPRKRYCLKYLHDFRYRSRDQILISKSGK